MQTELANDFGGNGFVEAEKGFHGVVKRLSQKFGFRSRSVVPRKLTFAHPVERLTFQNCTIHELHRGRPGREYLPLSDVEVLRKLSWRELGDGLCEYRFELSTALDGFWQSLFLQFFPDVQVQFDEKTLILVCCPADLEPTYQAVKQAMSVVNAWYADEREQLTGLVIAADNARRAAVELEENRKRGFATQFELLEL